MTKASQIFVLGDSRTGTTSLHKFFLDAGFNSVHYFTPEVRKMAADAGKQAPDFEIFQKYVTESGFQAFSDYPTRNHFREIRTHYPQAHFILSRRRDLETWMSSMRRYFRDRADVLDRMALLSDAHLRVNDEIRALYGDATHFMEFCVDDDSSANSRALGAFLGLSSEVDLLHLNASGPGS